MLAFDGLAQDRVYADSAVIYFIESSEWKTPKGELVTGKVQSRYANGNLKGQWVVKNGKQVSLTFYNEKGMAYWLEYPDSMVKFYDNGVRRSFTPHKTVNGKKRIHGLAKMWYENGEPFRFQQYRENVLDGLQLHYYEGGGLKKKYTYYCDTIDDPQRRKCLRDGVYQKWYVNGQLKQARMYDKGTGIGELFAFTESGILEVTQVQESKKRVHVTFHYASKEEGQVPAESVFKALQKELTGRCEDLTLELQNNRILISRPNTCDIRLFHDRCRARGLQLVNVAYVIE